MIEIRLDDSVNTAMEKAERMLAAIPGAIEKASRSAITRTAQHTRTQISRRVRERYAIGAGNLRTEGAVRITARGGAGGASADLRISGAKIPLYRFDGASPKGPSYRGDPVPVLTGKGWRMASPGVTAAGHLLRSTGPQRLTGAFVASFGSGHTGIFERTGGMTSGNRDEIKEKMGLSIPQMAGNEEVLTNLAHDASEKFEERMDHEIAAILNGWR